MIITLDYYSKEMKSKIIIHFIKYIGVWPKKKLNCQDKYLNYDKNLLIQKDISFFLIPKIAQNKRVKEYDIKNKIVYVSMNMVFQE